MRSLLMLALACSCAEPDVFVLPANQTPDRGARGVGPFDDGNATCAGGDGCFDCDLLDVDCPDGVTCAVDGVCTTACFAPDSDCSRADNGRRCTFGEECVSLRCAAIDGVGTCVSACFNGRCDIGFTCIDDVCAPTGC